jgi:hypothetical protein
LNLRAVQVSCQGVLERISRISVVVSDVIDVNISGECGEGVKKSVVDGLSSLVRLDIKKALESNSDSISYSKGVFWLAGDSCTLELRRKKKKKKKKAHQFQVQPH